MAETEGARMLSKGQSPPHPDADLAPRARRPCSLLRGDTPASTALGLSRQGHSASLYFPAAGKMEKAKARHSRTPHAHEMGRWKSRKGVR